MSLKISGKLCASTNRLTANLICTGFERTLGETLFRLELTSILSRFSYIHVLG